MTCTTGGAALPAKPTWKEKVNDLLKFRKNTTDQALHLEKCLECLDRGRGLGPTIEARIDEAWKRLEKKR